MDLVWQGHKCLPRSLAIKRLSQHKNTTWSPSNGSRTDETSPLEWRLKFSRASLSEKEIASKEQQTCRIKCSKEDEEEVFGVDDIIKRKIASRLGCFGGKDLHLRLQKENAANPTIDCERKSLWCSIITMRVFHLSVEIYVKSSLRICCRDYEICFQGFHVVPLAIFCLHFHDGFLRKVFPISRRHPKAVHSSKRREIIKSTS